MEHALGLAWKTIVKMVDGFFALLPNLVIGFAIVVLFVFIGRVSKDLVVKVATKARLDSTLAYALGTLSSAAVYIVGLLITGVVVIPHFSMANVVGGLGISSVAIGFAFKDILQNFFAGMLLLWQKPFRIGDQIKTKEFEGMVEDITIRSTVLRIDNGELAIIPNGDIYTNPIIVNAAQGKRRYNLLFSVKNADSIESARKNILQVISRVNGIDRERPATVYLLDANADTLNFDIHYWVAVARKEEALAVTDRLVSALRQQFRDKASDHVDGKVMGKTKVATFG